ncbi:MAG: hypothetical protein MJE68_17405 [Proteobacteria bacterium]|nr:hypothetical protein [Pseudomonadota bacterium]
MKIQIFLGEHAPTEIHRPRLSRHITMHRSTQLYLPLQGILSPPTPIHLLMPLEGGREGGGEEIIEIQVSFDWLILPPSLPSEKFKMKP